MYYFSAKLIYENVLKMLVVATLIVYGSVSKMRVVAGDRYRLPPYWLAN